jgi:hypothetical protein
MVLIRNPPQLFLFLIKANKRKYLQTYEFFFRSNKVLKFVFESCFKTLKTSLVSLYPTGSGKRSEEIEEKEKQAHLTPTQFLSIAHLSPLLPYDVFLVCTDAHPLVPRAPPDGWDGRELSPHAT